MSNLDPGPVDPRTAMWLAAATVVALLVVAAVLHNALSIVLVVLAVGDAAYVVWLSKRRTQP